MADKLVLIGVGAIAAAFAPIIARFENADGVKIEAGFDTVGTQRDRVLAGARGDLVTLSSTAMDAVAGRGLIDAASRRVLGSVELALGTPRGRPVPDVSTREGLRAALIAAPSLAHADPARGATAGAHFVKVLAALDLPDAFFAKVAVLPYGGDVVAAVGRGEFALGVSQSSEIALAPGVAMVAPLPPEFALITPYEIAAMPGAGEGARRFIEALARPEAQADLRRAGFSAP